MIKVSNLGFNLVMASGLTQRRQDNIDRQTTPSIDKIVFIDTNIWVIIFDE